MTGHHPPGSRPYLVPDLKEATTVFACDAFGVRVADTLQRLQRRLPTVAAGPSLLCDLRDARPLVLASGRPESALSERLDRWAHDRGVPFLPVTIEQPQLVVGPFVVPGESACHACYERRVRQHDRAAGSSAQLRIAYEQDAALRPAGWLPGLADLAAVLVAATLQGHPAGLRAGELRTVDTLTLQPSTGEVTGFTGCPRCDAEPTGSRSWSALADAWPLLSGVGR